MPKEDSIEMAGVIIEALPNTTFKVKLENELKLIEAEMSKIARKNPLDSNDWEAVEDDLNHDEADEDEVANEIETLDENSSVLNRLEPQYNDIKLALEKISKGTYGKCEIGGEEISEERLEANPSARTCVEHAKK